MTRCWFTEFTVREKVWDCNVFRISTLYHMIFHVMLIIVILFQISDDEDDIHPNIDTPSLFRWRHQARLERMAEKQKELDEMKEKKRKLVFCLFAFDVFFFLPQAPLHGMKVENQCIKE